MEMSTKLLQVQVAFWADKQTHKGTPAKCMHVPQTISVQSSCL